MYVIQRIKNESERDQRQLSIGGFDLLQRTEKIREGTERSKIKKAKCARVRTREIQEYSLCKKRKERVKCQGSRRGREGKRKEGKEGRGPAYLHRVRARGLRVRPADCDWTERRVRLRGFQGRAKEACFLICDGRVERASTRERGKGKKSIITPGANATSSRIPGTMGCLSRVGRRSQGTTGGRWAKREGEREGERNQPRGSMAVHWLICGLCWMESPCMNRTEQSI